VTLPIVRAQPDALPEPGASPRRASRRWLRLWQGLVVVVLGGVAVPALRALVLDKLELSGDIDRVLAYGAYLFVVCAGGVAFLLLMRRLPAPLRDPYPRARPVWLSPMAACIALSIGLGALALLAYSLASDSVVRSVNARLESVVKLKASHIEVWVDDMRSDLQIWSSSPELIKALDDWRLGATRDAGARQRLLDHLTRLSKALHFASIGIHDPTSGELLLAVGGEGADSPEVRRQAVAAASAPAPLLQAIQHSAADAPGGHGHLGLFSAVPPHGVAVSVVAHVEIDPERSLIPLIEQWPGTATSAQVLLIRQEDDALVASNDPQAHPQAPSAGRIHVSTERAIGTMLAPGGSFMRGIDERGRAMLAYARPLPGLPWVLVARLDEAEAFAQLNRDMLFAASMVGAMLVLAAWWWVENRRRAALDRQLELDQIEQAQRLSALSRRVVSVQEEERRRLAGELHDRTGTNLAAIQLNLKSMARLVSPDKEDDQALLQETGELLADTVVSIREFCGDLRPALLDYAGLGAAIAQCVAQFKGRTGVAAEFDGSGFTVRLPGEVESVLFRIVQEALLNCAKHGSATRLSVRLRNDVRRVTLTIEDDGVGFEPRGIGKSDAEVGSGLLTMRERAAFIGATFDLESAPGRGTRITVALK
jgi:signal transduction histidine kinase